MGAETPDIAAETASSPPPDVQSGNARQLWEDVLATFELFPNEIALLRQTVRVVDRLEKLAEWMAEHGHLDEDGKPTPAMVESRQQEVILGRLLTTLRLPEDWTDDQTRPQRRGAARKPYGARKLGVVK